MFTRFARIHFILALGFLTMGAVLAQNPLQGRSTPGPYQKAVATGVPDWQSPAKWRHGLTGTAGTLVFSNLGVEFQTATGKRLDWSFEEIQTFKLSQHELKLTSYQNRKWHLRGERRFDFEIKSAVPPEIAAQLAQRVGKPVKDADPGANAPAFAALTARHRTVGGGTNGVLRFRDTGIDYVTQSGRGARSWRWQDIRTLANPDPYHFRIGGYRETFEFELKQPMTRPLFDRLWNGVYTRDLEGLNSNRGVRP